MSWKDVIDRPEKQRDEPQTYYVYYKCTNCNKETGIKMPKGKLALKKITCPNCLCLTMVKVAR